MPVPVAIVYRGEIAESIHYGDLAIVDNHGRLVHYVGDPQRITFLRSAAKPFQAIPLVRSGAMTRFGLTAKHLAVICGSHSGEAVHVETVSDILTQIGLSESHLQCGVHEPIYYSVRNIRPSSDERFSPLQHNCSGKHAGMLALCVHYGFSVKNYLDFDHPVQKLILEGLARICGIAPAKIGVAVDGCSAPVHAMPLFNIAYGYARLVAPVGLEPADAQACEVICQAMIEYPEMVGGMDRNDTLLMSTWRGRFLAKTGAEGVFCVGLASANEGMAVKISDGNRRALFPFVLEGLCQAGQISAEELTRFGHLHVVEQRNYRDIVVGYLKPEFSLVKAE